MWWAVDEDWVEPSPAPATARRHLERKAGRKAKRACKARSEVGYVHAANPTDATVSGTASAPKSATDQSVSDILPSTGLESSTSQSVSTGISASVSASITGSSISSASASTSSGARPSQSGTSEAEGEQDGIQLNIGRSLVQVAKEGFEKYAQGLDTTWNVVDYPSSGSFRYS